MDFQRIVENEAIRMNVPIHFLGEDVAPGVKQGGSVSHLKTDVEITCLPRDLPEFLEVNVAELGLDEMLHLSDIPLPEGVEIPELAQGPEHDHAVVSIHVIKAAPIEEVVEEAEAEEAAAEAAAEDEAAPADEAAGADAEKSED